MTPEPDGPWYVVVVVSRPLSTAVHIYFMLVYQKVIVLSVQIDCCKLQLAKTCWHARGDLNLYTTCKSLHETPQYAVARLLWPYWWASQAGGYMYMQHRHVAACMIQL